jgi:hypothetical protein
MYNKSALHHPRDTVNTSTMQEQLEGNSKKVEIDRLFQRDATEQCGVSVWPLYPNRHHCDNNTPK